MQNSSPSCSQDASTIPFLEPAKSNRSKGRKPRKRCTDKVEEELKIMKIGNLYTTARDWKKWRSTLLEAEVHN
jgi:hypothetical protein